MPQKLNLDVAAAEMKALGADPLEDYPGLNRPWRCRCRTCRAEVTPTLKYARRYNRPCSQCPRTSRSLAGEVAAEIMAGVDLLPLDPYPGQNKAPWRCQCLLCGAEVLQTVNKAQNRRSGCRRCGIARGAEARRHKPETMAAKLRAFGGEPDIPFPGVDEPWLSHCGDPTCGRALSRRWKAIERSGYFCTYCSGQKVIPEQAAAAMIASGCTPLGPYPGCDVPWPAQCHQCLQVIFPIWESIQAGQNPCAYCAHRLVDPDRAVQLMVDAGALPHGPFRGASTPWPGTCARCAKTIAPTYNNVLRGHHPCRHCAGTRVLAADALALLAAHDLEPITEYVHASQAWPSQCLRCSGSARPVVSTLASAGTRGCPRCAPGGFRPLEPAAVYLLHHPGLDVYKVGVTNQGLYRIREHTRHGFTAPAELADGTHIWLTETGTQALAIEQACLMLWRKVMQMPQALTPTDMPQNGCTETARLTPHQVRTTIELLQAHSVANFAAPHSGLLPAVTTQTTACAGTDAVDLTVS